MLAYVFLTSSSSFIWVLYGGIAIWVVAKKNTNPLFKYTDEQSCLLLIFPERGGIAVVTSFFIIHTLEKYELHKGYLRTVAVQQKCIDPN